MFKFGRSSANAIGLVGPLRTLVGPAVGKLLFKLSGKSGSEVIVEGHKMVLATKGKYPPIKMAMGEYEIETTELFREHIKSGMSVLDIGAHVGYYTLLAAKLAGAEGRVFSFEPDLDNYGLLRRNIESNGYANITTVNQAVSDLSGTRTLFISRLDNGRHSIYHQSHSESESIAVPATTIDDYFKALDWPQLHFIKMDVEGSELDVLNGMTGLLDRFPTIKMIIELNPSLLRNASVSPLKLLEKMSGQGFIFHRVEAHTNPQEHSVAELVALSQILASSGDSINVFCTRQ